LTVGIGVIGVGIMGAEHARLLSDVVSGSEVRAVYDIDASRAAVIPASSGARWFDDPMVLIKDDAVDGVLVASSDATHEQFVLACVAAGKRVLCEKPLAPSVRGCERVLDAEVAIGTRLVTVGFMRRYDPGYGQLKAASGELGAPLLLHCIHRNASAPAGQPSTLLISGSAVHEIDVARWLLDDEPAQITVHTPRSSSRSGGMLDPLLLVIETTSGVLVDIEVFGNAGYGYDVRCELVAEGGAAELDSPTPLIRRATVRAGRQIAADWRSRFAEAYRRELQDWVDGIAVGQTRGASAWDGYVATVTAEAGIRALETGGAQQVVLRKKLELYR
jgi:myo-inositol 2-dehydrogenase/D-chiro-inositol 1-dehydrogenase